MSNRYYKNTNWLNLFVSNTSISRFIFFFISLLILECLFFTVLYYFSQRIFSQPLFSINKDFFDSLLFSLSVQTQTTGFDSVFGIAKYFSIFQVIFDKILWSIGVGYFTFKLLVPNINTVVFSKIAFYIPTEKKYCLLLVNTSNSILENLHFIFIEKINRRHKNTEEFALPYLKNSVLAIKICESDLLNEKILTFDPEEDGLKISISLSMSFAQFSVSKKYDFFNVLIIDNTDFMDLPKMQNPNLNDPEFWNYFNNPDITSLNFGNYLLNNCCK